MSNLFFKNNPTLLQSRTYVYYMKEQILQLRNQNKTYREIQQILGCSRSLVSYYVNPTVKNTKNKCQNKNRFARRTKYKTLVGGKCQKCGYDKCLDALQFHHNDPSQKKFNITNAIWGEEHVNEQQILDEIKKCTLLCANCHAEIHSRNIFST